MIVLQHKLCYNLFNGAALVSTEVFRFQLQVGGTPYVQTKIKRK